MDNHITTAPTPRNTTWADQARHVSRNNVITEGFLRGSKKSDAGAICQKPRDSNIPEGLRNVVRREEQTRKQKFAHPEIDASDKNAVHEGDAEDEITPVVEGEIRHNNNKTNILTWVAVARGMWEDGNYREASIQRTKQILLENKLPHEVQPRPVAVYSKNV